MAERLQGEARRQFCADNHYPDSFEPFAVAPYFWTQETPALAPLRLELDQAGTELVKAALEAVE